MVLTAWLASRANGIRNLSKIIQRLPDVTLNVSILAARVNCPVDDLVARLLSTMCSVSPDG